MFDGWICCSEGNQEMPVSTLQHAQYKPTISNFHACMLPLICHNFPVFAAVVSENSIEIKNFEGILFGKKGFNCKNTSSYKISALGLYWIKNECECLHKNSFNNIIRF